jgi:pilus assembly protein CpaD
MNNHLMRFAVLAAVLAAGSCAAPSNDLVTTTDPDVIHPITVQPQYRAIRVSFSGSEAGLMPEDAAKLDGFARDYLYHGDGSISISPPDGPDSERAIHYFGERLAGMGVPRNRILVGSHPVTNGDGRVEISFVSYTAHTTPCGDWSKNAADTADNLPMPDLGCSTQHNIAAMVADPRDLEGPRGMDAADTTRRTAVMGHYERGEASQQAKHTSDAPTEQSAPGSGIGN